MGSGPRIAPARPLLEEILCADLYLLFRIGLDDLGPIAAFRPFQGVAALVVGPGFGKLASILQGLTEREAEVVAIDKPDGRPRLFGAHPRQLVIGEAVGLEVGEAPVGVAEVCTSRGGGLIGGDSLRYAADGLEHMPTPKGDIPRGRGVDQHRLVNRQRLVLPTDAQGRRGRQGAVFEIGRIECQQPVDLHPRRSMFLTPDQGLGIVVACRLIIRRPVHHRLQQDFGVVQDVEGHTDPG